MDADDWSDLLDVNRDGVINVLDVYATRAPQSIAGAPRPASGGIAESESIVVAPGVLLLAPGAAGPVVLRIFENSTPLLGYSLAVRATPLRGAVGTVTAEVESTTFGSPFNLIADAPSDPPVDPLFSVISAWEEDGVFVTTNTEDLSVVLALPCVNDALAKVVFTASSDAAGSWMVELGPASVLSNGSGLPVNFEFITATIVVGARSGPDADLNNDGLVSGADLGLLLTDWGVCATSPADLDLDGLVGGGDLGLLLAAWSS